VEGKGAIAYPKYLAARKLLEKLLVRKFSSKYAKFGAEKPNSRPV